MIAQHVADVLAEEALDALAELLHALDVRLRHPPRAVGGVGRPRLERLMLFFARKFHDTSVTRSRIGGKARIGSTVTGFDRSSWFSRVMHIRRGLPFTSAEHDPHLPALQFQRTARSLACSAWIWWTASSTTMPSDTVGRVVAGTRRRAPSPRQIRNVACCRRHYFISSMICFSSSGISGIGARDDFHPAVAAPCGRRS